MRRSLLLLPLIAWIAAACASAKPAQLDMPVEAWGVQGANPRVWNRPIAFGPYRTSYVDEGATRSWLIDAHILSAGRLERGSRLRIAGVDVECHTRQLLVGVNEIYVDAALGRSALLLCGMTREGEHSLLTLSRTGTSAAWLTGEIRGGTRGPLTVRSLHQAKGARFKSTETLGFEILRDGSRVAVVETMNNGRVWIDPAERDQDLLAAVSASLLLFRDPDAEFGE